LPPLKYKVQILIFLLVGVLFGTAVLWYKTTIEPVTEIEALQNSYQLEIKNLLEEKQFATEDLYAAIKRIKREDSVLQIVGAQYRFPDKDDPQKVKTIEIDSYQEMTNVGKTAPGDTQERFEVILRIKSLKVNDLMQQLKEYYIRYLSLQENLAALEYQKKVSLALTFILIEEKQKQLLKEGQDIIAIEQQIEEQRNNYLEIEDQKMELQIELTDLKHELTYTHKTLAENIYFETAQKNIPWEIWNDIKAQTQNGENKEQTIISEMARKVIRYNAEIYKYNLMDYIYQNDLRLPLDAFEWPALKEIGEADKKVVKQYPTSGIGKKKILIISFIIALFAGIISVYIRVFVNKAGEKGAFKAQKQELAEALKSWKL